MKNLVLLGWLILLTSCVGSGFDRLHDNLGEIEHVLKRPNEEDGGLAIEITNSLAQHKPKIKFEICASENGGGLCFGNDTAIVYGDTAYFSLNKDNLKKLLKLSNKNRVRFQFNDSYSDSAIYWHCYEHLETQLKDDLKSTQYLKINVTQINTASYSCSIK